MLRCLFLNYHLPPFFQHFPPSTFPLPIVGSRGHYDSSGIQQRKSVVQSKWDDLLEAMSVRRRNLKASLDYQQFIQKANEVSKWIEVKTITAKDPNWKEPTNLQKKTQAHQVVRVS